MKKYLIQDVEGNKFYCDDNAWSDRCIDALFFDTIQLAWDKAIEINKESGYTLTVIPVIA